MQILEKLKKDDPQIDSVMLGCTEIGLLIKDEDTDLKLFDTTALHVKGALKLVV